MVEVFKTNVKDHDLANMLIGLIHDTFCDYKVNFDLDDCDNILRVKCMNGSIQSSTLVNFLKQFEVYAEVLPDDGQPVDLALLMSSTLE